MEDNEKFVDNIKPSTLENIDSAIFDWVDKKINAHCNTSDTFKKVPVVWSSAERTFQVKNYKELRDKDGSLITPFISVERNGINKSLSSTKGTFQVNTRGYDRISITKIINQEKTSKYANNSSLGKTKKLNFATKKTPQVVYQSKSVRLPTYFNVDYTISIKTSYIQHLNEILQPFITYTRRGQHFLIQNEGFQYEAFMGDSYESEESPSKLDAEERRYVSTMTVKVTGFFVGEDINQDDERVQTFENPVSIKFPRESLVISEQELEKKEKSTLPAGIQIGQTISALKKVYLIGDNINSTYVIPHNLNTRDMYISVRENFGDYSRVEVAISFIDLNNISIDMGDIITTDSYAVVIIG